MAEFATKRTTALALAILLPGMALLAWLAWQGLDENQASEVRRLRRYEELAAFQVVNNLGSELFHLQFTLNHGISQAAEGGDPDWPRAVESLVATYRTLAHFPDLLSDVVLVADPPVGPRRWLRWSSDGWISGERPGWISPSMTLFDQASDPVVDLESPVLAFSLPPRRGLRQVLVVRYSVDTVLQAIVPALVREAFAAQGEVSGYDVQVVRQATGLGAVPGWGDLIVPLVPRARFSDWLKSYFDRTHDLPRFPQGVYLPGSRWALRVSLLPGGLAAYSAQAQARNVAWVGGVLGLLLLGFILILVSLRRLDRAAQRERAFSSLVSHELKTPLAAIRSLAENLSDGVVCDPARVKAYGASLLEQSGQLGQMVGNIMALAVLESPSAGLIQEVFDLRSLAQEVASRAGLPLGTGGDGLWVVRGNRAAVGAALDNLVTNALRYGVKDGEEPQVSLSLLQRSPWGRPWAGVSVTDHGPEVPRSQVRSLFEPQPQSRRAGDTPRPGGGVGLSLVRATMGHLGGRVQVRTVTGGGLSFSLWFRVGGHR